MALAFYYAPEDNCIVKLSSEEKIKRLQEYLKTKGILTFAKNMSYPEKLWGRGDPSLHVVELKDLDKARQLTHDLLHYKSKTKKKRKKI